MHSLKVRMFFSLIESVSSNAMYWLVWQLFWASAPPPPPPPPPPPQPPPVPFKFRHKIEEKSVNQSKLYIFSRLRIQTIFGLRCLSEYKYNFIRARPGPDFLLEALLTSVFGIQIYSVSTILISSNTKLFAHLWCKSVKV